MKIINVYKRKVVIKLLALSFTKQTSEKLYEKQFVYDSLLLHKNNNENAI